MLSITNEAISNHKIKLRNMKTFNCHKCGCFLGEMIEGKIKHGTILLCSKCNNVNKINELSRLKTLEDLSNYKKGVNRVECPEDLKKILNIR